MITINRDNIQSNWISTLKLDFDKVEHSFIKPSTVSPQTKTYEIEDGVFSQAEQIGDSIKKSDFVVVNGNITIIKRYESRVITLAIDTLFHALDSLYLRADSEDLVTVIRAQTSQMEKFVAEHRFFTGERKKTKSNLSAKQLANISTQLAVSKFLKKLKFTDTEIEVIRYQIEAI